jgi:DNA-binding HxlR family transcriptional regulator
MLPRTYEGQNCSIARSLEVIGERWTPLILRDASRGTRRFEDFQRNLGIARNILSARLTRLCEEGLMERRRYQDRPPRDEYVLTAKGRDLEPVLLSLLRWGDRYAAPDGPPVILAHGPDGHDLEPVLVCATCGERLTPGSVATHPGPGARTGLNASPGTGSGSG